MIDDSTTRTAHLQYQVTLQDLLLQITEIPILALHCLLDLLRHRTIKEEEDLMMSLGEVHHLLKLVEGDRFLV